MAVGDLAFYYTLYLWLSPGVRGGGYLVERWVRGCAAQIGCFFGLSGFPMAPFLFENWFRYRSHFCKIHNFRWIFPFSLPIGCLKVLMHPNLYGKKYWLVLKRVLQEANGFVIGCKFASSLVLLQGGGRNFGPHIRTQPKVEYPPRARCSWWPFAHIFCKKKTA